MNNYEVTIGIEIHIELNTKTKMFSSSLNDFNSAVNTNVAPLDIGYPGDLPVVNKEAVIKAIKLAKSLNMTIDKVLHFDRKHYYYIDLPKGFQITQDKRPIGSKGSILIPKKEVKIERIHLEEDTAKSIHKNNKTFLNYNRSGIPLIEIVTYPVLTNAQEATDYVKAIQNLAISLGISNAKMEEGSLRADINISLKPKGQKDLGTKVEIKNLNSISNIKKSIEKEIEQQAKLLIKGEKIIQSTKRFDENLQKTVVMREKSDSINYKFFPEPNIPPIYIGQKFIDSVTLNELPWERITRYQKEGISNQFIEKLTLNIENANYFDQIQTKNKNKLAKIFFSEIVSLANSNNKKVIELQIDPLEVSIIMDKLELGTISGKHIKEIFPLLIDKKNTVNQIIQDKQMKQISNENVINDIINIIINKNEQFILENKSRPERITKFILGQLMKETKGQANPIVANKLVNIKIGK